MYQGKPWVCSGSPHGFVCSANTPKIFTSLYFCSLFSNQKKLLEFLSGWLRNYNLVKKAIHTACGLLVMKLFFLHTSTWSKSGKRCNCWLFHSRWKPWHKLPWRILCLHEKWKWCLVAGGSGAKIQYPVFNWQTEETVVVRTQILSLACSNWVFWIKKQLVTHFLVHRS